MRHTRKRAMRLLGYARVSTEAQDLTRQRQALKGFGCKTIFEDRASGKSFAGRPELSPPTQEAALCFLFFLGRWEPSAGSKGERPKKQKKVKEQRKKKKSP